MSETIDTEVFDKQKSGGGCGKVLLWLFFIALILSCLCCAGFIGTSYYFGNALKNGFVEDPVVAQQKTEDAFGELNLPETVKPRAFLNVKLFGKELGFAGIYSWDITGEAIPPEVVEKPEEDAEKPAGTDEKPTETPEDVAPTKETPADAAEATLTEDSDNPSPGAIEDKGAVFFYSLSDLLKGNEKEIIDTISQEITKNKNKDYTVKRTETESVTINGKANDFTFFWMENKDNRPFLVVSGAFESKKGETCNVLLLFPDEVQKETVIRVLERIQK